MCSRNDSLPRYAVVGRLTPGLPILSITAEFGVLRQSRTPPSVDAIGPSRYAANHLGNLAEDRSLPRRPIWSKSGLPHDDKVLEVPDISGQNLDDLEVVRPGFPDVAQCMERVSVVLAL